MYENSQNSVIDGPQVQANNEIVWIVKSQSDINTCYFISIAPKRSLSVKNKREAYKNHGYKCSCKDLEIVS